MLQCHWSLSPEAPVEEVESSHQVALAEAVVEEAWDLEMVEVASSPRAVRGALVAAVAAKAVEGACSRRVEPEAEAAGQAELAAKVVMA